MRNLLKSDLSRIVRDRLFLVVCIIGAAFAVFNPIMYKLIFVVLDADEMLTAMMGVDAKTMFFSSFSPSNNFGLIMPVLVGIILCKDFSYGTVRNKLICGKSRFSIFASMFTSATVITCGTMLAHGLLTLAFSLIFFKYQSESITGADVGYFFLSLLFEMLVYLFVSAIVSYLCASKKNVGGVIVLYIVVTFVFAIIGSITQIAALLVDPEKTGLIKFWQFLNNANMFTSTAIGYGTKYSALEVLAIVLPTVLGTALFALFGFLSFRKKDLK